MLQGLKAKSENHGFPCPQCNFKIKTSIEQILTGSSIFCSGCGLQLHIDKQTSAPALDALKQLNEVMEKASDDLAKAKKPGAR
ncbi:hypothetical protein [Polyangium sp. 6x1]|uniref:hypothetical protein n=1 Tax=Polyangium sp. 6x1 TaxID=3042689 RepID=UPI00248244F9|nr:hypothetical protein [Polyangium sp. 6x1]MDI1443846.1 hypothetical protein [Polyangium sp. 6x1]